MIYTEIKELNKRAQDLINFKQITRRINMKKWTNIEINTLDEIISKRENFQKSMYALSRIAKKQLRKRSLESIRHKIRRMV